MCVSERERERKRNDWLLFIWNANCFFVEPGKEQVALFFFQDVKPTSIFYRPTFFANINFFCISPVLIGGRKIIINWISKLTLNLEDTFFWIDYSSNVALWIQIECIVLNGLFSCGPDPIMKISAYIYAMLKFEHSHRLMKVTWPFSANQRPRIPE